MPAEETTIFEQNDIKVTNLRAVFGQKTYAVSNISAVETATEPPSQGLALIMSLIGIFLLIFFLESVINMLSSSGYNAANNGIRWSYFIFGAILLVPGIYTIRTSKPQYVVKVSTSSGEIKAFTSFDKVNIDNIVSALNTAIIQKG